jgi:hypothetical protein
MLIEAKEQVAPARNGKFSINASLRHDDYSAPVTAHSARPKLPPRRASNTPGFFFSRFRTTGAAAGRASVEWYEQVPKRIGVLLC